MGSVLKIQAQQANPQKYLPIHHVATFFHIPGNLEALHHHFKSRFAIRHDNVLMMLAYSQKREFTCFFDDTIEVAIQKATLTMKQEIEIRKQQSLCFAEEQIWDVIKMLCDVVQQYRIRRLHFASLQIEDLRITTNRTLKFFDSMMVDPFAVPLPREQELPHIAYLVESMLYQSNFSSLLLDKIKSLKGKQKFREASTMDTDTM